MSISPFVYWAQTEEQISLKVDLKDVKEFKVKSDEAKFNFTAVGVGARGRQEYRFSLDLFHEVDYERIKSIKTDSKVDVFIPKKEKGFWSRLICQQQKPSWLKIDFDRWKSEDNDDEDDEKPRNIMQDYPDMYDRLQKEELGFRRENFKKVYLILYNLFQFVGFMYILVVMGIRYSRDGIESMPGTYEAVGNAFKFIQLLQYLEVMHPIFGYTKGGAFVPFLQVTGRNFILFIMLEYEPRMLTKPVVFYLFLVWATIEIVRYPYYLTQLFKFEIGLLTWLRYSLWIPLYPLGVLCEGIIILRNIPYFEETKRLSLPMPNKWNFAFDMPTFLYLYITFLILPGIIFIMTHMQKVRAKKLGAKKRSKFVVPESPRWLLCKGRVSEVKQVLKSAARFNNRQLPDNLDKFLKPPCEEAESGVSELFRTKYLRLVTFCFLCIWFTMNLVYYGLVLNMNSFGGDIYVNSALAGLVEVPAIGIAMYIIMKTGKKWLFSATFFATSVSCLLAAIFEGNQTMLWLKITFVMIGKFTISAGNTIMPTYTAELYPTSIRNIGVGACNVAAGMALILTPALSELNTIGGHWLMTLLTAWSCFGGIIILFLPNKIEGDVSRSTPGESTTPNDER